MILARLRLICFLIFVTGTTLSCYSQTPYPNETIFRITPVRPVDELREEALKAEPPHEEGTFRRPDLVELVKLDPTIKLEIRYATTNNFLSTAVYSQARAFLQRPAAEALVRVNQALKREGYGLLIYDGYRPWYVTKMFWDAVPGDPEKKKNFVADPASGSGLRGSWPDGTKKSASGNSSQKAGGPTNRRAGGLRTELCPRMRKRRPEMPTGTNPQ
jgi:D-alanyl-D-alanine dipeptidase